MTEHADIAIVGAGAAGLFAAIFAGQTAAPSTRVVLLEGAKKPGTKILIAGGGRCNVTHDVVTPNDYAGGSTNSIRNVLSSFPVADTVTWFAQHGVTLKREDTGKLFPTTDRARTVLDSLLGAVDTAGVELRTGFRVATVVRRERSPGPVFAISDTTGKTLTADRVILATGGKALPTSGSDGFGYELARRLGHTVTDTWPGLAPLVLADGHWLTGLSGLSVDAALEVRDANQKRLHRQGGAVLFTHFGLSGPAPMDISRHLTPRLANGGQLVLNLLPEEKFASVDDRLRAKAKDQPRARLLDVLADRLPQRLAESLLRHEVGIEPTTRFAEFKKKDRIALAHALTALPLPVTGDRGFKFAECTAGGVPLGEVETKTMASRRCPGLHLCGEILDADGRIGGYNFQWAWCTGRLAGLAAGKPEPPRRQERQDG